jgi:aminobenzoyl-glutamate utilization protein B
MMTHPRLPLGLFLAAALAAAESPEAARSRLLESAGENAGAWRRIARQIWEHPEIAFQETRSAALIRDELRRAGFRVEENAAGMPTAFVASWGAGKPVIAILGEYDALPGLSQQDRPERMPRVEGGPGHGCGHNLFGAAAGLAATVVKSEMQARGLQGTIRYYGTPAEEGGGGKIHMLRAGLFRDVDAVLAFHPWDSNAADANPWLANVSARVRYTGRAAHAAASPEHGRSALDAVEVMTHAVNLLREHVPQETRIHYVITRGGSAANIVPESAEVALIVRHPDLKTLESIWERVQNCVAAGALATGTKPEIEIVSSYANLVAVETLVELLDKNLRLAGGVRYTAEERAFAEALRAHTDTSRALPLGSEAEVQPPRRALLAASTDVGDVSWNVPTGHFLAATFPPGIPLHTWLSTAAAGSSLGEKGMVVAAKTLALTAIDLLAGPALVGRARQDFVKSLGGASYRSLMPASAAPPGRRPAAGTEPPKP